MAGDFGHRQAALAHGRVQHGDAAPVHFLEHHKVIQVPVQDAGELELGQLLELQAQGAAAEVQRTGVADELGECGAFEGDREAAAQVGQVNLQAVGVGDHSEAG